MDQIIATLYFILSNGSSSSSTTISSSPPCLPAYSRNNLPRPSIPRPRILTLPSLLIAPFSSPRKCPHSPPPSLLKPTLTHTRPRDSTHPPPPRPKRLQKLAQPRRRLEPILHLLARHRAPCAACLLRSSPLLQHHHRQRSRRMARRASTATLANSAK